MAEMIGYSRVSTAKQNDQMQKDALEKAGCKQIYFDVASGSIATIADLEKCLDYLRAGDTLVA